MKTQPNSFRKIGQLILAAVLSTSMVISSTPMAEACGPDFTGALLINGNHPDLPLKLFAQGSIGVVQPGWAQSYLVIAYRYLSNVPLDAKEQASMLRLWHQRLSSMNSFMVGMDDQHDPIGTYFKLRARVTGEKLHPNSSRWDFNYASSVGDNAFANALKNLQLVIKTYGEKSSEAKEWVKAQDCVIGYNKGNQQSIPAVAPVTFDATMKAQRDYQVAAATFYANDLEKAKSLFEKLASSGGPYWKDLAWYMAARTVVNAAFTASDTTQEKDAKNYVNKILASSGNSTFRDDLVDLYEWMSNVIAPPSENTQALIDSIMKPHNERLGNDVDVLTSLLNDSLPSFMGLDPGTTSDSDEKKDVSKTRIDTTKYDLTDWIANVQEPGNVWWGEEERAKWEKMKPAKAAHALKRWRATKSPAWLVAAVSKNDLQNKSNQDLMQAASQLTEKSPAFLTAKFYICNSLIKAGKIAEARKLSQEILAMKNLPPSSKNLFLSQSLAIVSSITEFKKKMVQRPVVVTLDLDSPKLPPKWQDIEKRNQYFTCDEVISDLLSNDLNANLPQAQWVSWALDKSVPRTAHVEIVRAAWLRSKLHGQENAALDAEMLSCFPIIRKEMTKYMQAPAGPEKDFALACLILKYEGMNPHLHGGIVRHGDKFNEIDYYKANFWMPYTLKEPSKPAISDDESYNLPWAEAVLQNSAKQINDLLASYSKPVLRSLLNKDELRQVDAERKTLFENTSSKFLGDRVLAWAKSNPKDPRLPEALYCVVRLPKWSYTGQYGSKYSKAAYFVLHKQYPKNPWTQKAVCWY